MDHFTPIGTIPEHFPFLSELLKQAFIDRRREKVHVRKLAPKDATAEQRKEARLRPQYEDVDFDDWYIVRDEKPVPITYKTSTGKSKKDESFLVASASGHVHFAMLLDFIEWKAKQALYRYGGARPDRTEVLLVALGKSSGITLPDKSQLQLGDSVKKFKALNWKQLNNVLANFGLSGYSTRSLLAAPPPKAQPKPRSSSLPSVAE